jgi:hypothetical protein
MRLPRMTTRWWMIAAALVALLMGLACEVIRELGLARRYRELASGYRFAESLNSGDRITLPGGMTIQSAGSRRLLDYYAELRWKYEQAARYPWLSVEADPPLPEP